MTLQAAQNELEKLEVLTKQSRSIKSLSIPDLHIVAYNAYTETTTKPTER